MLVHPHLFCSCSQCFELHIITYILSNLVHYVKRISFQNLSYLSVFRMQQHLLALYASIVLLLMYLLHVEGFLIYFPSTYHPIAPKLDMSKQIDVVIAGAGVIGTSAAYYLAKNHADQISSITIIDRTGRIAPAASGKAGGFLALDWNDFSPVGPLARRSFHLHNQIADHLGCEKIQYRRLNCASISVEENNKKKPNGKKLEGVEWASGSRYNTSGDQYELKEYGNISGVKVLGDESTIAQVHPKKLCDAMWSFVQSVESISSQLIQGSLNLGDIEYSNEDNNRRVGKRMNLIIQGDDRKLSADAVLFACGPWTECINGIFGVKYHSVIIPTRPRVLTQAVFFDGFGDPEVYPRPDGTAYCCGYPDPPMKVTEHPGEEEVMKDKVEQVVRGVQHCSGGKEGILGKDPEKAQSCYLPSTPDNLPVIGQLEKEGIFCATGHSCWGILMAPATGESIASLIVSGIPSIDLKPFQPYRF